MSTPFIPESATFEVKCGLDTVKVSTSELRLNTASAYTDPDQVGTCYEFESHTLPLDGEPKLIVTVVQTFSGGCRLLDDSMLASVIVDGELPNSQYSVSIV